MPTINYLDKNGLSHFWDKINAKKQDKLTAGTNITISANNTISASQPTVGNATLTIQKNGTNVQTFTANATSNKTANITVPTKTSELTNDSSFVTSSGTVAKANQLTTARTIAISGGATGTATSFSGTANISIPVTDVKDAYVTWGGKNIAGNVTPDDMGCIDEFGHNKLAFLSADCIEVKYSTNGGSSWVDYGLTDAQKVKMVSTTGTGIYVGGPTDNATSSNITNLKLRVRIAAGPTSGGKIYTAAKKILINMSNQGAAGSKVDIRYRTIANYKAGTETWVNVGTFDLAGGSGWNSIPFNYIFGGSFTSQTSQMGQIEFILYCSSLGTWGYKKPDFIDFRLIGSTNWGMPSEMARAGHLYTVDENQNATFPANVSVTGSLKHGNYTYTLPNKTGTVAMTSDIPSSITVDSALSTTSTNPVQNKVITTELNSKADTSDMSTALAAKQDRLTAGAHINITGSTIKAVDYVHSEQPVSTTAVTPVVTNNMIADGTITADKFATGATLKLTLSTSDIGEGAALAANTLYGVYS